MGDSFTLDFSELTKEIEKMGVSDEELARAGNKAMNTMLKEVIENTPEDTGKMKSTVKKSTSRKVGMVETTVYIGSPFAPLQEFGTSTQNKNVGFFDKSIENTKEEVLMNVMKEIGW